MRNDETYMARAIELALRGWGKTSPNPIVGAVVVKGGRVVGEGYHRRAGSPHAEINALRAAGSRTKGATLYVTLEPCCNFGRTPPCTQAIISSGISRIVVGSRDPNPQVNGRGLKQLKKAGIDVRCGVLKEECRDINLPYEKFITERRPFVILKAALSLDGKIATNDGDSKWITSDECRKFVHRIRSGVDAIVVGANTVRMDDPLLTARLRGVRSKKPLAVVLDDKLDLKGSANLMKRAPGELLIATTKFAPPHRIEELVGIGHEVVLCDGDDNGRVSMDNLLKELGRRNIMSVLVEGGGEVFAACINEGVVDHVVACIAPKFIGGEGRNMIPGMRIGRMQDALKLKDVSVRTFGDDVVIEGRVTKKNTQITNHKLQTIHNNQITISK